MLQFPFIFIHPSKLKWVFNAKAFLVVIVAVGTMIWVRLLPVFLGFGSNVDDDGRLLSRLVLTREKLWVLLPTGLQAVSQGSRRSCMLSPLPNPLGLLLVCPFLLTPHLLSLGKN